MASIMDGGIIIAAHSDAEIISWDLGTGARLSTYSNSTFSKKALCLFDPGLLLVATKDKKVSLWSTTKGKKLNESYLSDSFSAIASDGRFVFGGSESGTIYIWHSNTGMLLKSFAAHYKSVTKICISDQGNILVTGGAEGNLHVWLISDLLNNQNSSPFRSWLSHTLPILDLKIGFGESNASVISSSLDCTCKIWNLGSGALIKNYDMPCQINAMALDQEEHVVYLAGQNGLIYTHSIIYAAPNDEVLGTFHGHSKAVTCISTTLDMELLISGSEDASIKVWNSRTRMCVRSITMPSTSSICALFLLGRDSRSKENEEVERTIPQLNKYGEFNAELLQKYKVFAKGGNIKYSSIIRKSGLLNMYDDDI